MTVSSAKRFLIGGIGGLAPVVALLIVVDFEKQFLNVTQAQNIGYLVRAFALFAIGGFVAWLHETEDKVFKVFEIGLGAPALIAGVITAKSLSPDQPTHPPLQNKTSVSFISSAYAQLPKKVEVPIAVVPNMLPGQNQQITPKEFTFPAESRSSQFLEGLLGIKGKQLDAVYYVIVGSHKSLADAIQQANAINSKTQELKADVYEPYGDNPFYAVVIGEPMKMPAAYLLKRKAIEIGLPKDTYLWTDRSAR